MSQRGSQVKLFQKAISSTNETSQVKLNPFVASKSRVSLNLTPYKNGYISGISQSRQSQTKRLSSADVGLITGMKFTEGQSVKGQSRISYVPYEKKVIDYETRTYTEIRPKTKRIVDYQQKKVVENVPREVVRQEYYPVQKIIQYHKEIVDVRSVEKKVKKLQYVPVEKKIVHYPKNEDYIMVQNQSKMNIKSSNSIQKNLVQYRPAESRLRFEYSGIPSNINTHPENNYNLLSTRYISKSPAFLQQNLTSSKVSVFNPSLSSTKIYMNESRQIIQPEQSISKNKKPSNLSNSRSKLLQRYGSTGKLSAANYL